jgi:hypothetical protein
MMVRGGCLLILRFVDQRSRSQLLKIEQKFDTFFVSAQYLKYKTVFMLNFLSYRPTGPVSSNIYRPEFENYINDH